MHTYISLGFELFCIETVEQQSQEEVEYYKVAHNENGKIYDETADIYLEA